MENGLDKQPNSLKFFNTTLLNSFNSESGTPVKKLISFDIK